MASPFPKKDTRGTDQAMTVRQVAEYLQVTERTVYKLAWAGQLPGFKVGNTWRFKRDDIDKWIETNKRRVRLSLRR
jgi:excisionase family DNA binding protein